MRRVDLAPCDRNVARGGPSRFSRNETVHVPDNAVHAGFWSDSVPE